MTAPKTCDGMLAMIDEFFARDTAESKYLWDILCALRGPDTVVNKENKIPIWEVKGRTTSIIRSLAFPRVAQDRIVSNNFGASFGSLSRSISLDSAVIAGEHFHYHVMVAVQALKAIGRLHDQQA